jgi:hypothetical protein
LCPLPELVVFGQARHARLYFPCRCKDHKTLRCWYCLMLLSRSDKVTK